MVKSSSPSARSADSATGGRGRVPLYPHDPSTLIPLLQPLLPYSLPILGILHNNDPTSIPLFIYATFPPSSIPFGSSSGPSSTSTHSNDQIWTIISPLPAPLQHHTRTFNSLESQYPNRNNALPSEQLAKARKQVIGAYETYISSIDPEFHVAGCLNTLWSGGVEDAWGIGEGEKRGVCGVWIKGVEGGVVGDGVGAGAGVGAIAEKKEKEKEKEEEGEEEERRGEEGGDEMGSRRNERVEVEEGVVVDVARESDVESFIEHTDIKRTHEYYTSRLSHSTTFRPVSASSSATASSGPMLGLGTEAGALSHSDSGSGSSSLSTRTNTHTHTPPSAIAQIITHSDSSLGSLFVSPPHRRQGLARRLLKAHLESGRADVPVLPAVNDDRAERRGQPLSGAGRGKVVNGEVNGITNGNGIGNDIIARSASQRQKYKAYVWTHVYVGNKASAGLFESMGWERVWDAVWVYWNR